MKADDFACGIALLELFGEKISWGSKLKELSQAWQKTTSESEKEIIRIQARKVIEQGCFQLVEKLKKDEAQSKMLSKEEQILHQGRKIAMTLLFPLNTRPELSLVLAQIKTIKL